jgi:hypothetical protein
VKEPNSICSTPQTTPSCILVEIHREFGDKHEIIRRFAGTHNIIEIIPSIRTASEIRVGSIKGIDLLKAADERRGYETEWAFS